MMETFQAVIYYINSNPYLFVGAMFLMNVFSNVAHNRHNKSLFSKFFELTMRTKDDLTQQQDQIDHLTFLLKKQGLLPEDYDRKLKKY